MDRPSNISVLVIRYENSSGGMIFDTPPFALTFNVHGNHVSRDNLPDAISELPEGHIFYGDADNTAYDTTDSRPNNYNPFQDAPTEEVDGRTEMPFENIRAVSGIMLVRKSAFESAGHDWTNPDAARGWLQANGTTMFFSPHAGVEIRSENP